MNAIADELARLHKRGPLTASGVVAAARSEKSPLHDHFTWDDGRAAILYRLEEARKLIRSVHIVGDNGKPRSLYVHVGSKSGEGIYELLSVVVTQPDAFQVALAEAHKSLGSAKDRVDELYEAAQVHRADEKVSSKIRQASKAVQRADTLLAGV